MMDQIKEIHYKSIFTHNGEKDTLEYKGQGSLCKGENTTLCFQTEEGEITIIYGQSGVVFQRGHSRLRFDYQSEVWNDYQLPYGNISLKTKLHKFEASDTVIKIKYELYDMKEQLATVYILVTMTPCCLKEEL